MQTFEPGSEQTASIPTRRCWLRFSLRTMLVLVTLSCILLFAWQWATNWVESRRQEFTRQMNMHSTRHHWTLQLPPNTPEVNIRRHWKFQDEYNEYHEKLLLKYHYAAQYPWWPVEPDPPEPVDPFRSESDWLAVKPQ